MFTDIDEVELAYALGQVRLHTGIRVSKIHDEGQPLEEPVVTTVGRAVFNRILPDEIRWVNQVLDKQGVAKPVLQSLTSLRTQHLL